MPRHFRVVEAPPGLQRPRLHAMPQVSASIYSLLDFIPLICCFLLLVNVNRTFSRYVVPLVSLCVAFQLSRSIETPFTEMSMPFKMMCFFFFPSFFCTCIRVIERIFPENSFCPLRSFRRVVHYCGAAAAAEIERRS